MRITSVVLERLHREFPEARIVIGAAEEELLRDPEKNLSAPMGFPVVTAAGKIVNDGDSFEVAGMHVKTLKSRATAQGSIVFVVTNQDPASAFVGDVIFQGSVGRVDLVAPPPGPEKHGNAHGIRGKLFALPPETMLFPGHGPATTVYREKASIPSWAIRPMAAIDLLGMDLPPASIARSRGKLTGFRPFGSDLPPASSAGDSAKLKHLIKPGLSASYPGVRP